MPELNSAPRPRPTLVYDGDCGICRAWVDYWQKLTGDAVAYRPYQEAAADFPAIPPAELRRAMQLVEPGGRAYAGAAASFRLLDMVPGHRGWWWLYAHVPGFAAVSEGAYTFLSRRRGLLAALTRLLWGVPIPQQRYDLVAWLFLRGLGLIYIAAFASLYVQVLGLVGSRGLLPLGEYLSAAHQGWGDAAYWRLPTLFWLDQSDALLVAGTLAGAALGALVALNIAARWALIALAPLYLSYIYAGQLFMSYQWDMLLVETGFLAIFLMGGSRIVVWLYRFLLFRFLFLAGAAKLVSGDPTWTSLTALDYHFYTQPLPAPLAWYAAQAPHWLLATATAAALVIELVAAFLILMPRRPRLLAAWLIIAFQLSIIATGNYNWFNLLTILLCLFLLDDAALMRVLPARLAARVAASAPRPGRLATAIAAVLALVTVPVGLNLLWAPFTGRNLPLAGAMTETLAPLLIVNPYGLFATTTTTRPEIIVEGSDDGRTWREYVFRYKPGPVDKPLAWNIPHQPRLDWQLWFAAYGSAGDNRWIERLLLRLLEGSPDVIALIGTNPFPDRPPSHVRAQRYDYRFTKASTRAGEPGVWSRTLQGLYFPAVSLANFASPTQPR